MYGTNHSFQIKELLIYVGSVTKFENTLKTDCFTSTIFPYQLCQNPQNLRKPDQSMKGLDFETKFLFSLCKTWMTMIEILMRKRFGCIKLLSFIFKLAGDCHLALPAFFNVPFPALGLCGWNDGDGRVLCTGAGFQPAG